MTAAPHPRPLETYSGEAPAAPDWFTQALAVPHESFAVSRGTGDIETLAWGERGRPGLLLLHGNRAHARWWSPIAALLSTRFRVAALSWPGMGGSDWRPAYREDEFGHDAFAAAEAAGLFAEGPPVFAAHSFGCGPLLAGLAEYGDRLAGGIIIDTQIERGAIKPDIGQQARHRVYSSQAEALSRFRLTPVQDCSNHYYLDWIARSALRPVKHGFVWTFDPQLWDRLDRIDKWEAVARARCPIAMIYGQRSQAIREADISSLRAHAPTLEEVQRVDGAAHHLMLDQPLATKEAIERMTVHMLAARTKSRIGKA